MSDKETQINTANAVLANGIKFKLNVYGIKIPIVLKPLKPGAIIEVSRELSRMSDVLEKETMVVEALRNGENYNNFASIVAISWANSPIKPIRKKIVKWLVKWFAPMDMFCSMVSTVFVLSDPERFFFLMASSKGRNFLIQAKQKAETQSGEPLP